MNCQDFWESMPEIGASDADHLQHAGECEACAGLLNRHRTLETGLRKMAVEMRHAEAPERVEFGLLAAFRSQKRGAARAVQSRWWVPAFSWGLAAAALAACAVLLLHPPQVPQPAHRATPATVELAATDTPDADVTTTADAEDGFIPLPNAEKIDPDEDVNVVRMEVPRSAMLAVGLAVSPDRVSELVEADVVLGADGMARAIRFVDE